MTASDVIADHVPIARPRSLFGNVAVMMARLPGTSSAPPRPWSERARMRWAALGAAPHHADAIAKIATPREKMRTRPK
jgi:hypothetical protein